MTIFKIFPLFIVRTSLNNCCCQRLVASTMGDQALQKFKSTILVFVPMVDVFPIWILISSSSYGKTSLQ